MGNSTLFVYNYKGMLDLFIYTFVMVLKWLKLFNFVSYGRGRALCIIYYKLFVLDGFFRPHLICTHPPASLLWWQQRGTGTPSAVNRSCRARGQGEREPVVLRLCGCPWVILTLYLRSQLVVGSLSLSKAEAGFPVLCPVGLGRGHCSHFLWPQEAALCCVVSYTHHNFVNNLFVRSPQIISIWMKLTFFFSGHWWHTLWIIRRKRFWE